MKNKTILMLLAGILMLPAHVFAEPDYLVDSDWLSEHIRMSLAYQQLAHLGYQNVRLYNGGWSQWGNWLDLPSVTGNQPFSGDFDL